MSLEYFLSISDKSFISKKTSFNALFAKKPNFLDRPACYKIAENHYILAIKGDLKNKLDKILLLGNPLRSRIFDIYDSDFNFLKRIEAKSLKDSIK